MSNGKSRLLTFALVIAVFATQVSAAAPGAMLYATGNVRVNGNAVNNSQAVLDGDRIETASGSVVTLAANGSSVLVDGNSSVMISNNSLNLTAGTMAIKTAKGMTARFGNLLISPASGTARYKLVQSGNMINVFAVEGDLKVLDGDKNIALASGKTLSRSIVQGGGTGGGGGAGGGGAMIGLTVGLIAGIAGALAAYFATRKSTSPNSP